MTNPSVPASPQQTLRYLLRRFEEVGIRPKTQLGQNFLIDQNLLVLLCQASGVGPDDVVLEVGGGTGALTALLAAKAAHVVSVEIDPQLAQLHRETLADFTNVTLLEHDALKNKHHVHTRVLEAVAKQLAAGPNRHFKLAANLPYHIATPLISNLLAGDLVPSSMTVTIQKELGDRILARPSTKDYGALSVWVQCQCRVTLVRTMAPSVFWPRPKVESAILHIELDEGLRARIPDRTYFHRFVRAMFFHRRKYLRSELISAYKEDLDKPQVDELLVQAGIDGTLRAEALTVEELLRLCEVFRTQVPTLRM